MQKLIAYYRVSTRKQERSGLGLEAQKDAAERYAESVDGEIIAEYQEAETGTSKRERPILQKAIAHCRNADARLVIAKLDRLSRSVAFTAQLMESGLDFVACDSPHATPLTIHVVAAVAEQEAKAISQRARETVEARRSRGDHIGPTNATVRKVQDLYGRDCYKRWAREAGKASAKARRQKSDQLKDLLQARLRQWQQEGMSLRQIAARLNEEGKFSAPLGGKWHPGSVHRILQ